LVIETSLYYDARSEKHQIKLKSLLPNSATYIHHHGPVYAATSTVTLASTNNTLPDDGATAPKHVGAVLM